VSWATRITCSTPFASDGHDVGLTDGRIKNLDADLVVLELRKLAWIEFQIALGVDSHPSYRIGFFDVAARIHKMAKRFHGLHKMIYGENIIITCP